MLARQLGDPRRRARLARGLPQHVAPSLLVVRVGLTGGGADRRRRRRPPNAPPAARRPAVPPPPLQRQRRGEHRIDVQLGELLRRATASSSSRTTTLRLVRLGDTPAARHARGVALHVWVLRRGGAPPPRARARAAQGEAETRGVRVAHEPPERMVAASAERGGMADCPGWARDDRRAVGASASPSARRARKPPVITVDSPRCPLESVRPASDRRRRSAAARLRACVFLDLGPETDPRGSHSRRHRFFSGCFAAALAAAAMAKFRRRARRSVIGVSSSRAGGRAEGAGGATRG